MTTTVERLEQHLTPWDANPMNGSVILDAIHEIRHLEACIADLRHQRDQWQTMANDANRAALHHSRLHLEERQHADELAEVLRITVRDWCPGQVFVPILDHHQARREQ